MTGRRTAFGLAYKNARRNKKRPFYLVLMIAVPVLVAVMTSTILRLSEVTPEEQALVDFGGANVQVVLRNLTPESELWVESKIDELAPDAPRLEYRARWQRFALREAGQFVDLDLADPLTEGLLGLTRGRAPVAVDEVAVSEHVASLLGLAIGDVALFESFSMTEFEVVGLVSHPVFWNVNTVVVTPAAMDEYDSRLISDQGSRLFLLVDDDTAFSYSFATAWDSARYSFYPQDREWPAPEEYQDVPEEYYAVMTVEQLDEFASTLESQGFEAAWGYLDTLGLDLLGQIPTHLCQCSFGELLA